MGFDAQAQPAVEAVVLEELTVTSNKREQRLDKVDGAVSAVTAAKLADTDVCEVSDLQKVLPGVVIANRGSRPFANVTIRGISSPDFYNPAVQVYVDRVPQASANLAQDLFDVNRIELLRGDRRGRSMVCTPSPASSTSPPKSLARRGSTYSALSPTLLIEIGTATTSVLVPGHPLPRSGSEGPQFHRPDP